MFSDWYANNNPAVWYVTGAILLAWIFKRFISRYVARVFIRNWNRTRRTINEKAFLELLVRPLEVVFFWLVIIISLEKLQLPAEVHQYRILGDFTVSRLLGVLSLTILIGMIIWLLLRMIDYLALILEVRANQTATQTDNQLIVFFKDFFKVILVLIGLLLILRFAFNQHVGALFTGLSIVGAALALATRESLENLIASFIIFFDKPFATGDIVKVHHVSGVVEKIGLRSTRIRTENKTFVTVPNKQMVDSIVDNHSLRTQRRGSIQLEVNAAAGYEKLQRLIQHIKQMLAARKDLDSFSVLLGDIQHTACTIPVDYFTQPIGQEEFNHIKNEINFQLIRILGELDIQLVNPES